MKPCQSKSHRFQSEIDNNFHHQHPLYNYKHLNSSNSYNFNSINSNNASCSLTKYPNMNDQSLVSLNYFDKINSKRNNDLIHGNLNEKENFSFNNKRIRI